MAAVEVCRDCARDGVPQHGHRLRPALFGLCALPRDAGVLLGEERAAFALQRGKRRGVVRPRRRDDPLPVSEAERVGVVARREQADEFGLVEQAELGEELGAPFERPVDVASFDADVAVVRHGRWDDAAAQHVATAELYKLKAAAGRRGQAAHKRAVHAHARYERARRARRVAPVLDPAEVAEAARVRLAQQRVANAGHAPRQARKGGARGLWHVRPVNDEDIGRGYRGRAAPGVRRPREIARASEVGRAAVRRRRGVAAAVR
mmetsp:Transcript_4929/g.15608  ORF Transcript_4929/g.15608 Transcript_4929/m.15608 type:complete len:263 (+) Transcript_4929:828-1616(+)